jgi:hypothetical protein
MRFGAQSLLAFGSETPLPSMPDFPWDALRTFLGRRLGGGDVAVVVVQPPDAARRRFYLHVYGDDGTPLAFGKVSAERNAGLVLGREADALQLVSMVEDRTFRSPDLIASELVAGHHVLLMTPVPAGSSPVNPRWTGALAAVADAISGSRVTRESIDGASWFREFSNRASEVEPLAQYVERLRGQAIPMARAHGDFVSWNVFRRGSDHWVVDWESFAPDAPAATDRIRFELGTRAPMAARNPLKLTRYLAGLVEGPAVEDRLASIVAFLHARGVVSATRLGRAWAARGPL